ncbi:MAG TPA: lanthionine synthetase LanC family protein, partial [Polyangiaceae bacterium]|nr:lanthionine synthetase LanC family protein [Polyangiaceae bacterium]
MSHAEQPLRAFVRAWLAEVEQLEYSHLRQLQEPPYASLPFGAAGIAYALLRAGLALGDGRLLERGDRWAAAAASHARARSALLRSELDPVTVRGSLVYGIDGILLVLTLLAAARNDVAACRARVAAFVRSVRRAPARPSELLFGSAGHLLATLTLLKATGDARLADLAREHGRKLAAPEAGRDRPVWTRSPDVSFAHGRAGVVFALLRLRRALGVALPPWFGAELERLTQAPPHARNLSERGATLPQSWCNGAAGTTLLWAAAHEDERHPRFLRLARASLRRCLRAPGAAGGDLCCGLTGRAYAALAMCRVAPGRAPRQHAHAL